MHQVLQAQGTGRRAILAAPVLAFLVGTSAAADDEGYDGLSISAKGEGFFLNPTLKRVTVSNVNPGSPAQAAGIAVGDQIEQVEGIVVVGTKANLLKPHLSKKVGEATSFVLVRPHGERYSVRVISVKQPKS